MAEAGPGTSDRSAAKGHREQFFPSGFLRLAVSGLDLLIAVYVVALALIALTGGVDLGVVSVTGAAKPLLVLVLLVPLRMAIGGRSWLADLTRTTLGHVTHRWRLLSARVPAAVTDSAFAMLVVLAVSLAAGFLANLVLEPATPRGFTLPFTNARFVEVFAAWDSGWYWDIAARGYYFRPDGQSSVAFFPLYPMLMRALAAPFGGGDGAAASVGDGVRATGRGTGLLQSSARGRVVVGNVWPLRTRSSAFGGGDGAAASVGDSVRATGRGAALARGRVTFEGFRAAG